ncbi:polymorphic toxin type 44 domain-containing protein [Cohnella silvisoli]|uniref:Polymorphic toxin type 44 domain-containing protein n=1 Tax=Cohnella silvisoli TaxID=2873699 RepID=A0ABV1KRZ0_9BACL|nr:polymorphic toxin type 44 domain-containing protein [Cohnella silvisoli]MCD9024658.1 hypothetical protein [Cohnella silvisoli]
MTADAALNKLVDINSEVSALNLNRLVFLFRFFPSAKFRIYFGAFFGIWLAILIWGNLLLIVSSLAAFIAVCCFKIRLTRKDKQELEQIIMEQANAIELVTKQLIKAPIDFDLLYETNLNAAKAIKISFDRYAIQKGSAYAHTYHLGFFYVLTRTNGIWDLKQVIGDKSIYSFRGADKTGEYIGNHHFGYMGSAVGLSCFVLRLAAGMYQVYSGTSDWRYVFSFFDHPADSQAIADGCSEFDSQFF